MLSNNSDFRIKLFLIYFHLFALPAFVWWFFVFLGKISGWSLILIPLFIPLYYRGFLRRKKCIAVNVFTSGEELHYDLDHGSHSISRSHIDRIDDSGLFDGNQEIIVKLKDGGEFTFYPSKDYGSFLKRRVLKELQSWLAQTSGNAVLKKGMPELRK